MGNAKDANDWVHPCKCSLVAHRKCLLEWVSRTNLDYKAGALHEFHINIGFESMNITDTYASWRTGRNHFWPFSWLSLPSFSLGNDLHAPFDPEEISQVFADDVDESVLKRVTNAMTAGIREGPTVNPTSRNSRKLVINTACPQCNEPILLRISRGLTFSASTLISTTIDRAAKTFAQSTVVGAIGASLLFSFGSILVSWGLKIMRTITPESTLLKLLDLPNAKSMSQAFQSNQIGFKHVFMVGLAPLYLMSFRLDNPFSSWLKRLYPLGFLRPNEKIQTNVKRFLLLHYPLAMMNDLFRLIVYNPIYFKWVQRVRPFSFGDNISIEEFEIDGAEHGNPEDGAADLNEGGGSIFSIIRNILSPAYHEPRLQSLSVRNFALSLRYDYSQALIETSFWEKLASTFFWPIAGKMLSELVFSKSAWFKDFIASQTSTPDDGIYLSNLIGCCAVVVLKDFLHFYVTWRRVKQLESMEVLGYMSPDWEYALNRKIGRILNQLSSLSQDAESYIILDELSKTMLPRVYQEQWTNISQGIPSITGKVNYFRYLVMKISYERSLGFLKA